MQTECSAGQLEFQAFAGRRVEAAFDGGHQSSDAGVLLLREVAERTGLIRRFASCFTDHRRPERIEHTVEELLGQRVLGQALGYEDLNDHDRLRDDALLALVAGKLDLTGAQRRQARDCGHALAGRSTLNRLERTAPTPSRYHKLVYDRAAIEEGGLWITSWMTFPRNSCPGRMLRFVAGWEEGRADEAQATQRRADHLQAA